MKSKIPSIARKSNSRLFINNPERIKVKLDSRTLIVLHSMNMFKVWRRRFPDAQIIK